MHCDQALVELLSEADLTRRATFPENVDIRGIAAHLAARVFEQAVEENLKISNKVPMVRVGVCSVNRYDAAGDAGGV